MRVSWTDDRGVSDSSDVTFQIGPVPLDASREEYCRSIKPQPAIEADLGRPRGRRLFLGGVQAFLGRIERRQGFA
jgi:hypothetical protein